MSLKNKLFSPSRLLSFLPFDLDEVKAQFHSWLLNTCQNYDKRINRDQTEDVGLLVYLSDDKTEILADVVILHGPVNTVFPQPWNLSKLIEKVDLVNLMARVDEKEDLIPVPVPVPEPVPPVDPLDPGV